MLVSVTRLRLRSVLYLPGFAFYAQGSLKQMRQANGFVDGRLIPDGLFIYWTMTRWTTEAAMKAWRGSGAHGKSMRKLAGWCDEAAAGRWLQEEAAAFPGWQVCYERLLSEGHFTPVDYPSKDQAAKLIAMPDYSREQRGLSLRHS